MTYADPNLTRPQDLLTYVDSVTQGVGFEFLLLTIFVVGYMGLLHRGNTASQSFVGSMFFVTMIAGLMVWLQVVGTMVAVLCLIVFLFSMVAVWWKRD